MKNLHVFCHLWVYWTLLYPSTLLYVYRIVNYSCSFNKHIKALFVTEGICTGRYANVRLCRPNVIYADQKRVPFLNLQQCTSKIVLVTWKQCGESNRGTWRWCKEGWNLSLRDECACQINDDLIMFSGSGFNLTDCIIACGWNLDVCFLE